MGTLRSRLSHAFAVDPPGPAEPTPEQRASVEWVCAQIAKRRLAAPSVLALETMRPLNWVGAQAMHGFAPAIQALASRQGWEGYRSFASFLERRGSVEWLVRRIEELEAEQERKERAERAERRAADERRP